MIVSASRRTDIPAFFADWFFEKLAEGFTLAVNPYNRSQVRRVELAPDAVDGLVFWTKNPAPMLNRLDRLAGYPYYFQCTLTGCGPEVEPGLPDKDTVVLPAMLRLAERAGPKALVWRFDPVVFGGRYTPEWHAGRFTRYAERLRGATDCCVFSFYSPYRGAERRMAPLGLRPPTGDEKRQTAALLAAEAARWGLALQSCATPDDLDAWGIPHGACIDAARLSAIAGREIAAPPDKNQRPGCRCAASVDIGGYGTCPAGCLYCYAAR